MELTDFLEEFCIELQAQLESDEARWGSTWLERTKEGQEDRIFDRFDEYYSDYKLHGDPIPWLKVAGNAMIAWVRENHPEIFTK